MGRPALVLPIEGPNPHLLEFQVLGWLQEDCPSLKLPFFTALVLHTFKNYAGLYFRLASPNHKPLFNTLRAVLFRLFESLKMLGSFICISVYEFLLFPPSKRMLKNSAGTVCFIAGQNYSPGNSPMR